MTFEKISPICKNINVDYQTQFFYWMDSLASWLKCAMKRYRMNVYAHICQWNFLTYQHEYHWSRDQPLDIVRTSRYLPGSTIVDGTIAGVVNCPWSHNLTHALFLTIHWISFLLDEIFWAFFMCMRVSTKLIIHNLRISRWHSIKSESIQMVSWL